MRSLGARRTLSLAAQQRHLRHADGFRFRTLFIAPAEEEAEVQERIAGALRGGNDWFVLTIAPRAVTSAERPLASKLAASPRQRN